MRIGLIYHQFRSAAGGLEKYLSAFASILADTGHDLVLIGSEFDDSFASIPGAEFLHIPCRGSKSARMRNFADRSAQAAASQSLDVTLGFGRTYAQDLHRAGGGCHRIYSRLLPIHRRIRWKNRLELALEKKLYTGGKTGHFVVNSSLVGRQIQSEYGVPSSKISVIHTPVDSRHFIPPDDPSSAKRSVCNSLGSDPDRPAFLFVSLSHRRKGLPALLDTWHETGADLWIAGSPLGTRHRHLIQSRNLQGRIHHLGKSGDLVPFFQAADGFLHPTLYDACANTVLQSMACGLPSLISSQDGASEFIRDGENGFLLEDPTDPGQILSGVQKILGLGPESRRILSESARRTVSPLTWESHLGRWTEAIRRTLPSIP